MKSWDIYKVICEKLPYDREELLNDYVPYQVNMCASNVADTMFIANEMNICHRLTKEQQFDFYYHIVPKGKRYSKWNTPAINNNVDVVAEYYNINKKVAEQYLKILTDIQIEDIRNLVMRGGVNESNWSGGASTAGES